MKYLLWAALVWALPAFSQISQFPGGGVPFTGSNPNGNACSTGSSPLLNYNGTVYSCQANAYAVLPSSGSAGVATFQGRAGTVTLQSSDLPWSLFSNPSGNLALTIGAFTTTFTANAATGAGVDLFKWTDTVSNTGTGILGHFTTAASSALTPWQADFNGKGFKVDTSGNLTPVGGALIASAAIPTLNQNTTGTAANISGTAAIANGGTGQTSASAAYGALAPVPTRVGDLQYWNGSIWVTLAGNNSGTNCFQENPSGAPTWATCGSGGGSPGGSATAVQLNASGSFGADATASNFGYNTTTHLLTLLNQTAGAGTYDFRALAHSMPVKTGTFASIPGSGQTPGEMYFETDYAANSHLSPIWIWSNNGTSTTWNNLLNLGPSGGLVATQTSSGTVFDVNTTTVPFLASANTFTGRDNFSGPLNITGGASNPATCTVNDIFFNTAATAGQNLYGCTATNTWTPQAGLATYAQTLYTSQISGIGSGASVAPGSTTYGSDSLSVLNTALSGGNVHLIVNGQYSLSGHLKVYSNTWIDVQGSGNGFIMRPASNDDMVQNADMNSPTTAGPNSDFLVSNITDQNIRITGGTWNANATNAVPTSPHKFFPSGTWTGQSITGMFFLGVQGLEISGATIYNPPTYSIYHANAWDVHIHDNTVLLPTPFPTDFNRGTIQSDGPEYGVWVVSNYIQSDDDAISFNSDENRTIGGSGFRNSLWGPQTDIHADGNFFDQTYTGIRLLTTQSLEDRIFLTNNFGSNLDQSLVISHFFNSSFGNGNFGKIIVNGLTSDNAAGGTTSASVIYVNGVIKTLEVDNFKLGNQTTTNGPEAISFDLDSNIQEVSLNNWQINDSTGIALPGISHMISSAAINKMNITGLTWDDTSGGTGTVLVGGLPTTLAVSGYIGQRAGGTTPIPLLPPGNSTADLIHATSLIDDNGKPVLQSGTTAAAVNWIDATNAATGGLVRFDAKGSDANVSIALESKGSGDVFLGQNGSAFTSVNLGSANLITYQVLEATTASLFESLYTLEAGDTHSRATLGLDNGKGFWGLGSGSAAPDFYVERTAAATGTVTGNLQLAAGVFSTLPTCNSGAEGISRAVTDSTTNTWGATITGSGADHVLAYCDGTNWTVAAK